MESLFVNGSASIGGVGPGNTLDMNNSRIVNLASGLTNPTDVVNRDDCKSLISSNSVCFKAPVVRASISTDTLAATYITSPTATLTATSNVVLSLDGSPVTAGTRVLIKDATPANWNGIYIVTSAGVSTVSPWLLTRAVDFNLATQVVGAAVLVTGGSTLTSTLWTLSTNPVANIDSTPQSWVQPISASGVLAGAGLNVSGNTLSVNQGYSTFNWTGAHNFTGAFSANSDVSGVGANTVGVSAQNSGAGGGELNLSAKTTILRTAPIMITRDPTAALGTMIKEFQVFPGPYTTAGATLLTILPADLPNSSTTFLTVLGSTKCTDPTFAYGFSFEVGVAKSAGGALSFFGASNGISRGSGFFGGAPSTTLTMSLSGLNLILVWNYTGTAAPVGTTWYPNCAVRFQTMV